MRVVKWGDYGNFKKKHTSYDRTRGGKMVEGCKHVELKIMVGWFLWVSYILTLNKLGNLEKQI